MGNFARRLLFLIVFSGLVALASTGLAAHVFEGIDVKTGKDVSLIREDTTKKGTVVVFMSVTCPCSLSHVDEIKRLAVDYPDFRFIGVNSNAGESLEIAKTYFQSFPFIVLRDHKSSLAIELKALKTPHAFVFNRDGTRVFQGGVSNSSTFGKADRKYLREALEDLSSGREVRTPLARALGCAIDRTAP